MAIWIDSCTIPRILIDKIYSVAISRQKVLVMTEISIPIPLHPHIQRVITSNICEYIIHNLQVGDLIISDNPELQLRVLLIGGFFLNIKGLLLDPHDSIRKEEVRIVDNKPEDKLIRNVSISEQEQFLSSLKIWLNENAN